MVSIELVKRGEQLADKVNEARSLAPLLSYVSKKPDEEEFLQVLNSFGYGNLSFFPSSEELLELGSFVHFDKQLFPFGIGLLSYSFQTLFSEQFRTTRTKLENLLNDSFFKSDNNKAFQYFFLNSLGKYGHQDKRAKNLKYNFELIFNRILEIKSSSLGSEIRIEAVKEKLVKETKDRLAVGGTRNDLYVANISSSLVSLHQRLLQYKQKTNTDYPVLWTFDFSDLDMQVLRYLAYELFEQHERFLGKEALVESGLNTEEVIILVSLCFASSVSKEENRKFWKQMGEWLMLDEGFPISSRVSGCCKKVQLPLLQKDGGSNEYVQCFRTHSIVANRVGSLTKIAQVFKRVWMQNGYHCDDDDTDQLEMLYSFLKLFSDNNSIVPIETQKAFNANFLSTVEFLQKYYAYFLNRIRDTLDYKESERNDNRLKDAIDDEIDGFFNNSKKTKKDLIELIKTKSQNRKIHDFRLEIIDGDIYFITGIQDVSEFCDEPSINLVIRDKNDIVQDSFNIPIISGEIDSQKHLFSNSWVDCSVYYESSGKQKKVYNFPHLLVFDERMRCLPDRSFASNAQNVFIVASPSEFEADTVEEFSFLPRLDKTIYKVYLDEENLLFFQNKLYGFGLQSDRHPIAPHLDNDSLVSGAFVRIKEANQNSVVHEEMEIRKKLPTIMFAEDVELCKNISVTLNGRRALIKDEKSLPLDDGSNRMYMRIPLNGNIVPNASVIFLNVSSGERILFSKKFFFLHDFKFSIEKKCYREKTNCPITSMEFDDKVHLFAGKNYPFPHRYETPKFQLNSTPPADIVLELPLFSFAYQGKLISKDAWIWGMDLVQAQKIKVMVPSRYSSKQMSISLFDDKNHEEMRLRRSSSSEWSTDCLKNIESCTGRWKLRLLNEKQPIMDICTVFSSPFVDEMRLEFSNDDDSIGQQHSGKQPGIYLKGTFHTHQDEACHCVSLNSSNRTYPLDCSIKDGPIDILLPQIDTLEKGVYSLTADFKGKVSIFSKEAEAVPCSIGTCELTESIMGKTIRIDTMLVDRVFWVKGNMRPKAFYLDFQGQSVIERKEYEVEGFLSIRNEMQRMWNNPFWVTVTAIDYEQGILTLSIRDNEMHPLQIEEKKGFINPRYPTHTEHEITRIEGHFALNKEWEKL